MDGPSPNKAVCGVSAGKIKWFSKKLPAVAKGKSQSYILYRYATGALLLHYRKSIMVYFSFETQITSSSKTKC